MSTLAFSIIALVVVVVAGVVLFNLWQSRDSRQHEDQPNAGGAGQAGRFDMSADAGQRGRPDDRSRSPARRWQPGADQNAWARQRREPTLTTEDSGPAVASAARRPGADDFDPYTHESAGFADDAADRGDHRARGPDHAFPMSADDDLDAGGAANELGPPEFEAPRLEPMPFEPDPASAMKAGAAAPGHRAPPTFDDTRPLPRDLAPAADSSTAAPVAAPAGSEEESHELSDPALPPREPDFVPADVDLVVNLIPRSPVNAERLIALTSSLRHVGSKSIRIEIDSGHGRWVTLQSGTMVGCLRCSAVLANRQGPLNAVELSDFSAAMESLSAQIGARFTAPDMNQVLRQARELDAVAAKLDTQVDLGVESAEPIVPAKLAAIARKLDLVDRGGGRFACFAEGGELIYSLMAGETADMLAFVLDVPRTAQAHDPWRSMVSCASSCAQLVGGRVVDSAGRGMSVGMIDTVGQQIDKRYRDLADAGLKAGVPSTLRVFN